MFGGQHLPDAADFIAPTFDIFRASRETLYNYLQRTAIVGTIVAQCHKLYSLASPSTETVWSSAAVKKLEELVRLRGGSFSSHLGAPVPAYLKKVFEQPGTTTAAAATATAVGAAATADSADSNTTAQLSREQKIARLLDQCNSRMSAIVTACVLHSYLFSVEMVSASIIHPILVHRRAMDQAEAQRLAAAAFGGNNTSNSSGAASKAVLPWWTSIASFALRVMVGSSTTSPAHLMEPPPTLELRGSVASASVNGSSQTSNDSDDEEEDDEENGKDDGGDAPSASAAARNDDDDNNNSNNREQGPVSQTAAAAARNDRLAKRDQKRRETRQERAKLRRASPTNFNEMLLNLIRGLKSQVDSSIQAALQTNTAGRSAEEAAKMMKRRLDVKTDIIDGALLSIIRDSELYVLPPAGLEWMVDAVVDPRNSWRSASNKSSSPASSSRSSAGNEEDAAFKQDYFSLLNYVAGTASFRALVQKGAEQVYRRVAAPAMLEALLKCKTCQTVGEEAGAASAEQQQQAAAPRYSVLFAHLGATLSHPAYAVFDCEVHSALLPELFGPDAEAEKRQQGEDEAAEQAYLEGRMSPSSSSAQRRLLQQNPGVPQLSPAEEAELEQQTRVERQLRRAARAMRKFQSFPSLTSFGGQFLQFARGTIECSIGTGLQVDS